MHSSLEEAMSFFTRWRDDRTKLDFIFSGNGVGFKFSGFLLKASFSEGLVAVTDETLAVTLTASLEHARSFDFADPREAPEEHRRLVEENIEHVLEIAFRGGIKLGLYELRV